LKILERYSRNKILCRYGYRQELARPGHSAECNYSWNCKVVWLIGFWHTAVQHNNILQETQIYICAHLQQFGVTPNLITPHRPSKKLNVWRRTNKDWLLANVDSMNCDEHRSEGSIAGFLGTINAVSGSETAVHFSTNWRTIHLISYTSRKIVFYTQAYSQLTAHLVLTLLHVSTANRSHLQEATTFKTGTTYYRDCQIQMVKYL
jgi:hypothetical protein